MKTYTTKPSIAIISINCFYNWLLGAMVTIIKMSIPKPFNYILKSQLEKYIAIAIE